MAWHRVAARLSWGWSAAGRPARSLWRRLTRPERVRLHGVELALGERPTEKLRCALYRERYERGEARAVLLGLERDDVVLEIGCGAGFIATLCARRVGSERVTCYEANPALLPRIRATFAANGVSPTLVNAALGRDAGEVRLFVEREFVSSSLTPRGPDAEPVRVRMLPINEELRRIRPTCLVVDVEGGESELLPAIDWRGIRKLAIDLHPDVIGEARARELVALLAAQGFRERRCLSSRRKKFLTRQV